jgi:hypothetical protein
MAAYPGGAAARRHPLKQKRSLAALVAFVLVMMFLVTKAGTDGIANDVREHDGGGRHDGGGEHDGGGGARESPVVIPPADDGPADAGSVVRCSAAKGCAACLTRATVSGKRGGDGCVWCAPRAACTPAGQASPACPADDVEDTSCPAVLQQVPPQTVRVIHVAIRKGGPEALVQMHLALVHWGFRTTLDTRRSKKEKGGPVVPFFLEAYKAEFAKAPPLRYEKDYQAWLDSAAEGDVLMSTETWRCRNDAQGFLRKGARQMQWHLTVWPKRDRSGCTIASHTNYIAEKYMRQSRHSVMFPYISPHILRLAATRASWAAGKTNLVMYDGDVKMADGDFKPLSLAKGSAYGAHAQLAAVQQAMTVKKATGMTPEQLYAKYGQAKVGIDWELPGAERFVYEAALFDVCIIVDDTLNGGDRGDLPIPDRFRVKPNDKKALHERVAECLLDYDGVIAEFAPLKRHVHEQRTNFLRHVRRYFSNSVHVVTVVATQAQADRHFARFVAATLIQVPFAAIEVRVAPGVTLPEKHVAALNEHSMLAAVTVDASFKTVGELYSAPPRTNAKRSLYVAVLPVTSTVVSEHFVHLLGTLVSAGLAPAVFEVKNFAFFPTARLGALTARCRQRGAWVVAGGSAACASGGMDFSRLGECGFEEWHAVVGRVASPARRVPWLVQRDESCGSGAPPLVEGVHEFLCSHPLYTKFGRCDGEAS